jgi:plastocyanin
VRASGDGGEFLPGVVDAGAGDVLRFSSEDGGPHALVFDQGDTDAAGFAFVTGTDQRRSLPLTEQGAAWIVTFAEAPVGRYVIRCLTHGATLDVTVAGRTGR